MRTSHASAIPAPRRWGGSMAAVALVGLSVAGAVLATQPKVGPLVVAGGAALALTAGVGLWAARTFGAQGVWVTLIVLSILAGQMGSVGAGGQSGKLLWADVVIGVGALVALARRRLVVDVPAAPFLLALLPFLGWTALSLLVAQDPLTAIAELKEWVAVLVVAVAASSYASDGARARRLLGIVALTGALMSANMLMVAMTSPVGPLAAIVLKLVDLPWGRTNYLAGHLILAIPIAIGLIGNPPGCASGWDGWRCWR